jgi:hypothetical protein
MVTTGSSPPQLRAVAGRSRPPLARHPWRWVIVLGVVLLVLNLGIVVLSESDTSPEGRTFPNAIDTVSPRPGELIRPQDTITADLRSDLTGVLVIDGAEVPEDQTERVAPLGLLSFRPGPDQDLERFEPGTHTAAVRYWPQGKPRPESPAAYSWTFRVGA